MKIKKRPVELFPRLHEWAHRHPRRTAALATIGLLVAASLIAFATLYNQPVKDNLTKNTSKSTTPEKKYYSPLDGMQVADLDATKAAVTGIMIENSPDARPQSGVKKANVVYEAIAEGGITRFLALYQHDKPSLVGPVRSVRMYYVDWIAPYQASVAHIGGSAAALREVRNGNYRDIDQFFNAGSYWRAKDRYAPHNVYTNFERLDALNSAKGYTESTFGSFPRIDGKKSAEPNASTVNLNFSGPSYNTSYAYDPAANNYIRSVGGAPHLDREDGQITPSVVVAMRVDMTKIMEDGWRESITTTGGGEAVVFQNGTATACTWRKNDRASQLELIDADGKPVNLIRGQTWIAAVPNQGGSVSWQ